MLQDKMTEKAFPCKQETRLQSLTVQACTSSLVLKVNRLFITHRFVSASGNCKFYN